MTALPTPPMLYGQSTQELVEVRRYLWRLVEQLNLSLNNLDSGNFSTETTDTLTRFAEAIGGRTLTAEERKNAQNTAGALRDLIIKNADIVRKTMDEIDYQLNSEYIAEGQLGTYRENVATKLSATAYNLRQELSVVSDAIAEGEYSTQTKGYIQAGIIDFDDNNVPIIGIAIGTKVTTEIRTIGQNNYEVIALKDNLSVWTADKLSFYIGDGTSAREVAYFSGDRLYVNEVSAGAITIGGNWRVDDTYGYTITWIGG